MTYVIFNILDNLGISKFRLNYVLIRDIYCFNGALLFVTE